jgi:predicted  nucleic acid-binding Zn-ribbon protein
MASGKGGNLGTLIGLVLSIIIIVVLVFFVYTLQTQMDEKDREIATLQDEREEKVNKEIQVRQQLADMYELLHGTTTAVDPDRVRRDYLAPAGKRLVETLNMEQLLSEDFGKDLHKEVKLAAKEYAALLDLYGDLFIQLEAAVPELNRLRLEKTEVLSRLEQARESARREREELNQQITSLRTEKSEIEQKAIAASTSADARERELLSKGETLQKRIDTLREDAGTQEALLKSKISELEGRIAEITEKQRRSLAETEADGEVVYADQGLGLAWVNVGRDDRLRRGLTFEVYQFIKGGKKKRKGMVEVKRVDDETAQVAILSQLDPADPIVKGDYISSPLFDRRKDMVFVFVGDRPVNDRYEMSQLQRRIEEFGGRVDKQVTIDTDFAVAIENAEQSAEFRKAVQFGVIIMRESELLDFLGR